MRKAFYAVLGVLGMGAICGCGGGGGGSSTPTPTNPLAGYYGGQGTVSTSSDAIIARIGVGADGRLCGTLHDPTARSRTLVGALVADDGSLSEGSVQSLDANGTATGTGALTGTITPQPGTQSGSTSVSVLLTVTGSTGSTGSATYTFQILSPAHFRSGAKKPSTSGQG